MRQSLLGADGDDGLALMIELDLIAPLVPVAYRPA
jgi:hypothetical protein